MAQLVKNPPAMWETWVRSFDWEDPLEKGKAAHSVFWSGEFYGQRSLASCTMESVMMIGGFSIILLMFYTYYVEF